MDWWRIGLFLLVVGFFLLAGWNMAQARQIRQLETLTLTLADGALADVYAQTCPHPNWRILSPLPETAVLTGSPLPLLGTADWPGASQYRLEIRPVGAEQWTLLHNGRSAIRLGELGTWQTGAFPNGTYEIRLQAVGRNNIPLAETPDCQITVTLRSAP
ncbi:MAG: hypothetical protein D6706_03350 [Chloroflexi bacterium]|nr:MAG: hypothetical protein D6706_03350 [Chloroflexota bacterium]